MSSNSFKYTPESDNLLFYDLEGSELDSTKIEYRSAVGRVVVLDNDITEFLLVDKNTYNACKEKKTSDWVLFNAFDYELKNSIKRKLGYPVVLVELTEQHLKDAIEESISEISPWVVQPRSVTVDCLESIDMSEYDIAYIIKVVQASTNRNSDIYERDIFSTSMVYQVSSYRDILYSNIELGLVDRISNQMVGGIHWKWIPTSNTLMVDPGNTGATRVTVEYSPKITSTSDLSDEIYLNLVKKFALAFSRETLVSIRGKYTVDGSPVSLDADMQDSKSSSELDRLRLELKDTVSTHFMID